VRFCAKVRLGLKSFHAWGRRLRPIDLEIHRCALFAQSAVVPFTVRVVNPPFRRAAADRGRRPQRNSPSDPSVGAITRSG
jgi:hypothetical protein